MKLARKKGATSQIFQVFIQDSSVTTGAGLTGLAFNTAGLTAYYHRDTAAGAVAMALVTMTVGTFTSLGFKEIDSVNMPGWYQFCPPDAAFVTGASTVGFHLQGATNMVQTPIEVDLDSQVDMVAINGGATDGYNATLKLASLSLNNAAGNAMEATSSGGGGAGLFLQGDASTAGFSANGGSGAPGAVLNGTNAPGLDCEANGNFPGILSNGSGTGAGMKLQGGATGPGQYIVGGAGSSAVLAVAGSNSPAVNYQGDGANPGLQLFGGSTGPGFSSIGGAASGEGAIFTAQAGNSDGFKAVKNGTGVDIRGQLADLSVTAYADEALLAGSIPATLSIKDRIVWNFMAIFRKKTFNKTTGANIVSDSTDTAVAKMVVSDDGTTVTELQAGAP
jgi:hypothetical protein